MAVKFPDWWFSDCWLWMILGSDNLQCVLVYTSMLTHPATSNTLLTIANGITWLPNKSSKQTWIYFKIAFKRDTNYMYVRWQFFSQFITWKVWEGFDFSSHTELHKFCICFLWRGVISHSGKYHEHEVAPVHALMTFLLVKAVCILFITPNTLSQIQVNIINTLNIIDTGTYWQRL
jgi:hypothetical protein